MYAKNQKNIAKDINGISYWEFVISHKGFFGKKSIRIYRQHYTVMQLLTREELTAMDLADVMVITAAFFQRIAERFNDRFELRFSENSFYGGVDVILHSLNYKKKFKQEKENIEFLLKRHIIHYGFPQCPGNEHDFSLTQIRAKG